MNFPKFWARVRQVALDSRGRKLELSSWRWSDESQAAAERLAAEAVRQMAERVAAGGELRHGYGYADRPLREPVLKEIRVDDGSPAGVVTRNAYGCLVLNTRRVMFVDIDLEEGGSSRGGFFGRLFRKGSRPDPVAEFVNRVQTWTAARPGWGWRVYRTRAGLRLLATHDVFGPDSPESLKVQDELGADPLYRRLCKNQKCFRARLTPKPWRCGMNSAGPRWPFADSAAEAAFKAWEGDYLRRCAPYATCELVASPGAAAVHPEVRTVQGFHDQATRVGSGLELA